MEEIKFRHKKKVEENYKIFVGRDLKEHLASEIISGELGKKFFVVTDKVVKNICTNKWYDFLKEKKIDAKLICLSAGEKGKSLDNYKKLCEELYSRGCDKESCIIVVGGGVVGDLCSFVSATYLGGINIIQIPTTLLGCVDSALGGLGVLNLDKAKNYLQTHKKPNRIYIDLDNLESLPRREVLSGLAEVIKYGLTCDSGLVKYMEKNSEDLIFMDEKHIIKLIKWSIEINNKLHSSEEDSILTLYAHTVGHALEVLTGFKELRHGEAVAIGMVACAYIGRRMKYLFKGELERCVNIVKQYKLPYKIPKSVKVDALISQMKLDAKSAHGDVQLIMLKSIGKVRRKNGTYLIPVPDEVIRLALEDMEKEDIK